MRTRKRVLLVEDDADMRQTVVALLRDEGHEALAAENGHAALALMRQSPPDIVVLDLMLPVMSGWEFRVAQKQDPELAGTPVIAVTASGTPEAAAVDADLCLRKPYSFEALLRAIDDVVLLAERRKGAARRAQAERMASLGTLAAGLAHEVSNPLTYLLMNLQRASSLLSGLARRTRRLPELEELATVMGEAQDGAERIRALTREIRTFARADEIGRAPVNVAWCVDSALRLADHELRNRARVVKRYDRVPPVLSSEGRMGQVFLNLLLNAAQAIAPGDVAGNEVRVTVGTSGRDEALVEIEDTGCGIPDHHLARVFEPFYSTKPLGKGTGLGLSICHGIVTAMGGRIEVRSVVGRGSTFRVFLPAAAAAPRAERRPTPLPIVEGPLRRRLMIVDDEPLLAKALGDALKDRYDVTLVDGGAAALSRLGDDNDFDVILTDVNMPDLSGLELYDRLATAYPDLAGRIIFMTGGVLSTVNRERLEASLRPLLDKPFGLERLHALMACLPRRHRH